MRPLPFLLSAFLATSALAAEQTDVVVVGATPTGVAAQSITTKRNLRSNDVPALQREIVRRWGVILYENIAKTPAGL